VQLTDIGVKNYEKVLAVIFAQINLLKASAPPSHLVEAFKKKMKDDFERKTAYEDILHHACFLSEELRKKQGTIDIAETPPVTLIYKPYAFDGIK
jgi:secreted Zn-dependent insulinase-like peptidase